MARKGRSSGKISAGLLLFSHSLNAPNLGRFFVAEKHFSDRGLFMLDLLTEFVKENTISPDLNFVLSVSTVFILLN